MAMELVSTVTVGSGGAATIEFTGIPQTGKDLLVVFSCRDSDTNPSILMRLNGDTGASDYVYRGLSGTGSAVNHLSGTQSYLFFGFMSGSGDTANTFGNGSAYVSNYTAAANKPVSFDNVSENNATAAYQNIVAGIYQKTTTVSSLQLGVFDGGFVQHSTASLYIIS